MSKPFTGVKILDFTRVLAGPYGSYQLALLGADSHTCTAGALGMLDPAPTHEALAQRIGSQREAVSRELGRLERAELLHRGRRRIEVDVITHQHAAIDR